MLEHLHFPRRVARYRLRFLFDNLPALAMSFLYLILGESEQIHCCFHHRIGRVASVAV